MLTLLMQRHRQLEISMSDHYCVEQRNNSQQHYLIDTAIWL